MPLVVILAKVTDQGAKNIQNIRQAGRENMERCQRLGIKTHGWYLTQSEYDVVVIAEAPDAETMLAQAAGVAGTGNTRTETLRAFHLDEVDQALQKLK